MIVALNGRFVPLSKALVSVTDHGFLYGDGVYETIRVTNGVPFLLNQHLERLVHSARAIRLSIPFPLKRIQQDVVRLIQKNGRQEAAIRITVTRGPGPYGFDPRLCRRPTMVMTLSPFSGYPVSYYESGITAAVVGVKRNHPLSLPPTVKSTSCLNGILAKIESLDLGAQEGIMTTLAGVVAEGTVSNVFVVKRQRILTPALGENFLPGVTRDFVCQLAEMVGLEVIEKDLKVNDLRSADELFLTSTLMNIMPVSRLVWKGGQKRFSSQRPVTQLLSVSFEKSSGAKW